MSASTRSSADHSSASCCCGCCCSPLIIRPSLSHSPAPCCCCSSCCGCCSSSCCCCCSPRSASCWLQVEGEAELQRHSSVSCCTWEIFYLSWINIRKSFGFDVTSFLIYPSGYVMAREKDCMTVDMCLRCWLPCSRPQFRCWPCTRLSGPCRPPSADCARCPRCRCRGCCRGEARSRTPALCSGEHNVMCYVRSKIQILFS